ncbi:VanZ family protein [Jeotgalibacillus proteolyticus]|uniref:VanZ-like domain-containing protein n=1 Tax=Jeotgalibacillus proteolyticus TaxID=2082395 RepID=A0A2S5GD05_9BACL|nr:VanZ family protein [Jeotgalibacillus proteolyticus]PPA70922.1 hypothetical protein C4B60_09050 [Jeotgalibacillus proteolyticus]
MSKGAWKICFLIYMVLLLNFVVIKFNGNINELIDTIQSNKQWREQGEAAINLVPFRTFDIYINNINSGFAYKNILGNIIPFIPMGFLIPAAFFSKMKILKTLFSCFVVICSIEIVQLTLYLGSFDIDDIILNLLSCIIGILLFVISRNFKVVS